MIVGYVRCQTITSFEDGNDAHDNNYRLKGLNFVGDWCFDIS